MPPPEAGMDRLEHRVTQPESIAALYSSGVSLADLLREINTQNDHCYQWAAELACDAAQQATDCTSPPVPYALVMLGSGGRGESLLHPDQDHALILGDYPESEHLRVIEFFHLLATRLIQTLAAAGFPPDKNHVMASNPSWRKRLDEWQAQFRDWWQHPRHAATVLTSLCIDFRHVHGDPTLSRELRHFVRTRLPHQHVFLRELERLQFEHDIALTPFGTFKRERLPGQVGHGQLDIKRKGLLPLLESVRLLALREGLEETGTLTRLEALNQRRCIHPALASAAGDAFEALNRLLLDLQIGAWQRGEKFLPYLQPAALPRETRRVLRRTLRQVRRVQSAVHMEFTAELF